jgi:Tfp pilus assembly protein PilW
MTFSSFKRNTRAFSLVEVLIYVAVTVLVSLAGVLTYLSLDSALLRHATERSVNHAAQVALERISRELHSASTVDTLSSVLGVSPSVLVLDAGATTTMFSVTGSTLMLTQNGVVLGPLTSDSVIVEDFTVNRYVGTSTELVRVGITLSAETKAASTTRTYYTSAVLRGSYE